MIIFCFLICFSLFFLFWNSIRLVCAVQRLVFVISIFLESLNQHAFDEVSNNRCRFVRKRNISVWRWLWPVCGLRINFELRDIFVGKILSVCDDAVECWLNREIHLRVIFCLKWTNHTLSASKPLQLVLHSSAAMLKCSLLMCLWFEF